MLKNALVVLVAALVVAPLAATPAQARPPRTLSITTDGYLTGPTTAAGTWTMAGAAHGSGTYVEDALLDGSTLTAVKTLTSPGGTIVLKGQTSLVVAPDGTVTFHGGWWYIASATGRYEGLIGGGIPAATPDSWASFVTGQVHVTHSGFGYRD